MHVVDIFPAHPSDIPHLAPPPAAFLRDCAIVEARMLREAPIVAAKAEELRHIPDYMLAPPPAAFLRDAPLVAAKRAEYERHIERSSAAEAETAAGLRALRDAPADFRLTDDERRELRRVLGLAPDGAEAQSAPGGAE